ncbi:MAG TPA: MCE family protein [Jatrophihabitans sp.]|jgi:phospholipid/cholesterol/gamma-HCH transport system substrate-binding protein
MATALPRAASRMLLIGLALAVVVGLLVFIFLPAPTKTVSAKFERAVGLYAGSTVRLHGVKIGEITKVKTDGDGVEVTMKYDKKVKLPAYADDAKVVRAAIIPPSLVSDRYVQLQDFASCGGKCGVLAGGAQIPMVQTASPVELDDIYGALNQLNVALGPQGANSQSLSKNGPLSDLVNVGAANLQGNGAALGNTMTNLSKAIQTLANGREDLFGTVKNLQVFTDALVANDTQVRNFNTQLAQVTASLADERGSLGLALKNLSTALGDISSFVKTNGSTMHTSIVGLENVTKTLNNQKGALNEILAVAPFALSNLVHTYNPVSGTLDTRANIGNVLDPSVICAVLDKTGQGLSGPTGGIKIPGIGGVVTTIGAVCDGIGKTLKGGLANVPLFGPAGGAPPTLPGAPNLPQIPGLGG